ncbi:MAG: DUF4163 domain-containing protein [Bacteroidales bacterium]|nr:DUF4163 domain-containing protein [Bacteroidales bacterium]
MKKLLNIVIILFCIGSSQLPAQVSIPFYKHFTGLLDTNMFIVLDLQSDGESLSGQYNYRFSVEGSANEFYFGKTVPVEGEIEGESLTFRDYNSEDSEFSCTFSGSSVISGTWQGGKPVKEIPFTLLENYTDGSFPLKTLHLDRSHNLLEGDEFASISPQAHIKIFLLYPESNANRQLKDTLDMVIAGFMRDTSEIIKSPELFLENIVFDFFQSYVEITEGIEDFTNVASFNWNKEYKIEVLNNQFNILSLKFTKYAYTGGAHGISIIRHEVFDTKKNRRINIKDFIKQEKIESLSVLLEKKLRKLNGILADESLRDAGFLVDSIGVNDNFFINTYGVGFFYNTYEIAPYASGTTALFIPFSEINDLLKPGHPFTWLK